MFGAILSKFAISAITCQTSCLVAFTIILNLKCLFPFTKLLSNWANINLSINGFETFCFPNYYKHHALVFLKTLIFQVVKKVKLFVSLLYKSHRLCFKLFLISKIIMFLIIFPFLSSRNNHYQQRHFYTRSDDIMRQ